MEEINKLFKECEVNGNIFQIVCGSSDGFAENYQFATNQTILKHYHHIFDFAHIVKRLRNLLFNRRMDIDGGKFCIESLLKLKTSHIIGELITEDIYAPIDKMKMEPVRRIMDSRI